MNTRLEMKQKMDALRQKENVRILAMESSCDETAAAVIQGRKILSDEIASSASTQRKSPATGSGCWQPGEK